jgi:hypothetical protein
LASHKGKPPHSLVGSQKHVINQPKLKSCA